MVQEKTLKDKILILTGPTAVGKSDIAIKLAQKYDGQIISADSMQIYKNMNIGTGKISAEQMQNIPHYLIDILQPYESYSVSVFVKDCKEIIKEIVKKKKLPIIVGGTGLYINALINGHNFANVEENPQIREKCNNILKEKGNQYLYNILKEVDEVAASKISENDSKRIIRALEIFYTSGICKSESVTLSKECPYDYKLIILDKNRQDLYNSINQRVEKMFQNGLVNEVENLIQYKDMQSMQAIGYKEVVSYILENGNLKDTIEKVKQNSRHYAKRQMTYFRWIPASKTWINCQNFDEICLNSINFIKNVSTTTDIVL